MAHNGQTFQSPRSAEVMQVISMTLTTRGMATATELAKVLGLTPITVGSYLAHMQTLGSVHCAVPMEKIQGGSLPAQWAAGRASPDAVLNQNFNKRRVIVRKEWAPNHARSAMDCLLFGTPAILGAAA
jgi:hypothetical protein